MIIISGEHRRHTAKLLHFDNTSMTVDCSCGTKRLAFKPFQATFSDEEMDIFRQSYKEFIAESPRENRFWKVWALSDIGNRILARRLASA